MMQPPKRFRKVAANYIYLPGYSLVKNGYVILEDNRVKEIVETGQIREIQGLEFYGGMIVAGYVRNVQEKFQENDSLLFLLDQVYQEMGNEYEGIALLEGADLIHLQWKKGARVNGIVKSQFTGF